MWGGGGMGASYAIKNCCSPTELTGQQGDNVFELLRKTLKPLFYFKLRCLLSLEKVKWLFTKLFFSAFAFAIPAPVIEIENLSS